MDENENKDLNNEAEVDNINNGEMNDETLPENEVNSETK